MASGVSRKRGRTKPDRETRQERDGKDDEEGTQKEKMEKREGIKRRERQAGARVPCHDLTLWRSSSETAWASLAVVRSSLVMSPPTVAHAAN